MERQKSKENEGYFLVEKLVFPSAAILGVKVC